jgi:PAS domain S-box-containing protein
MELARRVLDAVARERSHSYDGMTRMGPPARYALAFLWIAVAALARLAMDPLLGEFNLPYITFFLAVTLAAWQLGSGPGLGAVLAGGVAARFLFVPPRYGFAFDSVADVVGLVTYLAVGAGIVGLRFLSERAESREAARAHELRLSEDRFRSLVLAVSQVVWTTGADGFPVEESASWTAFTGQTPEQWRGWGWLDAIHPDDRDRVAEIWKSALAAGSPFETDYRIRRADGQYVWMLARAVPVWNDDGTVREWIGNLQDLSDRRRAEETQRRLGAIVESSDDAIVGKTLEGVVTSWNRGAERVFGYTAAEMVGERISRLLPPDRVDELPKILAAIGRGERMQHFQTERIRKDGRRIYVSLTVSPVFDASGNVIGASKIARDITETKRAEAQLRRNEERARRTLEYAEAIMASMSEGLYMLDTDGRVTFVNAAAERLFGLSRQELLGRKMHGVTHYARPDGRPFPAEECEGLRVLREGETLLNLNDFFIRKDGSFFPVTYSASPVHAGGGVVGVVVVFRDQTETVRRAVEREELLALAELARAEAEAANRAKDEFLSVVSHELRTPLASMLNWLRVLRSGQEQHTKRALESLQRSAEAQTKLVEDLIDTSRIATRQLHLERALVDLASVVRAALDAVLPGAHAKRLRIETKLEIGAVVAGDAQRLQQVAQNLLSNAVKFAHAGGLVQVAVEKGYAHARLVVRDDGPGISADFLPHVFERFRQAEPAESRRHGGLGLGLAIVRQIVELHGGSVSAESEGEGKGATFTVTLPLGDGG